ncbi:unnamed protein product [Ilex paraguariensis]|uniref:Enhancer of polycomb-like protein n=1 Tax=Ilex paraguariensis TaxID=185542 RepID=A0ABC8TER5_9AQUA
MESSVGKSGGAKISKKTRSLNLESLYKSSVLKEGNSKGKNSVGNDEVKKKKRKSRKELPLSSIQPASKKSKKSLDEVYAGGVSSGDLDRALLGLRGKLSTSNGSNDISLGLDGTGNVFRIPKRPRGSRKKFESNQVSNPSGLSSSGDHIAKSNGEAKIIVGNQVLQQSGSCDSKACYVNQVVKLNGDSGGEIVDPKVLQKSVTDDYMGSSADRVSSIWLAKEEESDVVVNNGDASCGKCRTKVSSARHTKEEDGHVVVNIGDASSTKCRSKVSSARHDKEEDKNVVVNNGDASSTKHRSKVSSARHAKEEDGHVVVHNSDASSRKSQSSLKKRKDMLTPINETVAMKVGSPLVNSVSDSDGFQDDDDEENLEANAARMLSSRFDPSYTEFSSKTSSRCVNGLSFLIRSGQNFVSQREKYLAGSTLASVDSASRVLRPRKQHNEKGLSSKRRHFYEILSVDLDAYWVLNRRIKVFWPLDESWYYGLVNDYDSERKLHHIKYDDRDEEWVNLQNERFKLLLLPSEVPGKAEPENSAIGDEGKRGLTSDDDSYVGRYMDSEPIMSWLARSSHRVKSSPGAWKKQKTSHPSPYLVPPLLSKKIEDAHVVLGFEQIDTSAVNGISPFPDRSSDDRKGEKSVLETSTSSKGSKPVFVYSRRQYHKKDRGLIRSSVSDNASESVPVSVPSLASGVYTFQTSKECMVSLGCFNPDEPFWSIDDEGLLKLTMPLMEAKRFRFELCLSVPPFLEFTFGVEHFWLFQAALLLRYGTVVCIWPKIHLEILFVDNIFGLRFFLFEGSLKQAVAFVFLVLTIFHQSNEQGKYVDLQLPVTSVRFTLSCVQDFRKKHVFANYSFAKVKCSKWLCLDRKLQQHCLLTEQLPLSECTYDNIRAREGGGKQLDTTSVGMIPSAFQGLLKKSVQSIMAVGYFKKSCYVNMSRSSCDSDLLHRKLPPFSISFNAAPTFFRSLHLKLLMEHSVAGVSLQDHDSLDCSESNSPPIADDQSQVEVHYSEIAPDITPESNLETSLMEAACSGWFSSAGPHLRTDSSMQWGTKAGIGKQKVSGISTWSSDHGNNTNDAIVQSRSGGCNRLDTKKIATLQQPVVHKDHTSPSMSPVKCYSSLNGMKVDIPSFDKIEKSVDERTRSAQQSSDLAWNSSDDVVCSPNSIGARSLWHHNINSPSSSPFDDLSHVWPDGATDFICNGFGNGPKKPRTQVHYALPFGGFNLSSKHNIDNQKGLPYKRIRRTNEKKTSDGSRGPRRNLELLACDANVLITHGDRGWRECGACVFLELADQNEWKLAVKLSGTAKYSYKVHHVLQPGSTNRYTHAMMWKGGKDWVLEFPDRSQWMLFKEMHEECYNRNIRAASVKSIPIPGVRLVAECGDSVTEMPFLRSSSKYFRQVENDVDMAMDASRIFYDMDSDDEQWILSSQKSSLSLQSKCEDISEDLFEKTMDMFEKVSYAQQRDHFTSDEIKELMVGFGPVEVINIIYEHWRLKRQRKGMPLIRQLQVPSTLLSSLSNSLL